MRPKTLRKRFLPCVRPDRPVAVWQAILGDDRGGRIHRSRYRGWVDRRDCPIELGQRCQRAESQASAFPLMDSPQGLSRALRIHLAGADPNCVSGTFRPAPSVQWSDKTVVTLTSTASTRSVPYQSSVRLSSDATWSDRFMVAGPMKPNTAGRATTRRITRRPTSLRTTRVRRSG